MAIINGEWSGEMLISLELQRLRGWLVEWLQKSIQHSGMTTFVALEAILRLLVLRRWALLADNNSQGSSEGLDANFQLLGRSKEFWREIESKGVGMTAVIEAQMQKLESLHSHCQGIFVSSPLLFNWQVIPEPLLRSLVDCLGGIKDVSVLSPGDLHLAFLPPLLDKWHERESLSFRLVFLSETLVRLMNSLLALEPEQTVYDPFTGFGQLLRSTFFSSGEEGLELSKQVMVYGQLAVPELASIARLTCLLLGINPVCWQEGDALDSPLLNGAQTLQRFDRVISAFPFSTHQAEKIDFYNRFPFGIPSPMESDGLYLQHALSSLMPQGRAVLLITAGFLFRQSARLIRQGLLEADLIRAIIVLPLLCLPSHNRPNMPMAILVLEPDKSSDFKDGFLLIDYSPIKVNTDRSFEIDGILAAMEMKPGDENLMAANSTDMDKIDPLVRWVPRSESLQEYYNLNPSLYWPRGWQDLDKKQTLQYLINAEREYQLAKSALDSSLRALGWEIPTDFDDGGIKLPNF